jgi:polyhydroxyalkanoate synthesis regulator phasin
MSLEETKKLYHKLVKQGVINKDIQMKEVKKMFKNTSFLNASRYNAKKDLKKLNKITITLTKEKIKQAASSMDMMISTGSLFKDHPIVEFMEEVVEECIKKKNEKK